MTIVDWRQVDARALALVFARERARWLVELGWETRDSWLHVETARTTWGLPGLAAVDDGGRVRGITFFHEANRRFEIGGVFAESDAVREALIDAAVGVCTAAGADQIAAFIYTANLPIARLFDARGFAHDRVDYLSLNLGTSRPAGQVRADARLTHREWREADLDGLAALLHASYDLDSARRFVGDGTEQSWRDYLDALVRYQACGAVLPSCTRVAMAGDALVGAALVTSLAPATAHIAQVAVHPDWRRQGLAGDLIDEAARRGHTAGYARMTLLASGTNAAAQALYRDRGYQDAGMFLAATKHISQRLVALAS